MRVKLYMNLIDYSKIQIYIPQITAYYIMSIYFCILNAVAIFLFESHDKDYALAYISALFIITCAVIKYAIDVSMYAGKGIIYKFIILISIVFITYLIFNFTPAYGLIISSLFSIMYTVNTLSLLSKYSSMEQDFLNKYKNMINMNNYIVSFYIVIICAFVIYCLVHMLNFSILVFYFDIGDKSSIFNSFGELSVDATFLFLAVIASLTYVLFRIYSFFLSKYQYVFIICALSEYKQIPLSVVYKTSGLLQIIQYKNTAIQNWFQTYIGNFVNNVYLDIDKEVIVFKNNENNKQDKDNNKVIDTPVINNEIREEATYSLDNAIKKIEALMVKVVYRGTNLTNTLFTMKLYLEKINNLHTDKSSYDKYIERINNKYIPYIEHLVDIYLRNIDLQDESFSEIQEKIIYTLDKMSYVLQVIFESKIELIKFNLEVELDTIDLLIKHKGYYKEIL